MTTSLTIGVIREEAADACMARISSYIFVKQWVVITHPCHNFNGGLTKWPLELGLDEYTLHEIIDTIIY